jgi:hypothetical protein
MGTLHTNAMTILARKSLGKLRTSADNINMHLISECRDTALEKLGYETVAFLESHLFV